MKGFVGLAPALAPDLAVHNGKPVHVALSYDAEVSCLGVPSLIAEMQARGIRPSACLVGEPTMLKVVNAHKGGKTFRCVVRGKSVHSAFAPQSVNAVEFAARLVDHIRIEAERLAREETRNQAFEVTHTTMQTGVFYGGDAPNVLPVACEFLFNIRHLPTTSPDALADELRAFVKEMLLPEMRARHPDAAILIEAVISMAALDELSNSGWCRRILALTGQDALMA